VLDGKGGDPVWKQAYKTSMFRNRGVDNLPVRTEAALLRTDKALYVKITCHGDTANIKTNQMERDDDQWKDTNIELSLDPNNTRTDYFYLVTNSAGIQYDALASVGMNINKRGTANGKRRRQKPRTNGSLKWNFRSKHSEHRNPASTG
jgi:Domain of unknown function (DUF1083).